MSKFRDNYGRRLKNDDCSDERFHTKSVEISVDAKVKHTIKSYLLGTLSKPTTSQTFVCATSGNEFKKSDHKRFKGGDNEWSVRDEQSKFHEACEGKPTSSGFSESGYNKIRHAIKKNLASENRVLLLKVKNSDKSLQMFRFWIDDDLVPDGSMIVCTHPDVKVVRSMAQQAQAECNFGVLMGGADGFRITSVDGGCIESPYNRVLFSTEEYFLKILEVNPMLDGYSHVLVGGAQKRTIEVDVCLGMLKQLLRIHLRLQLVIFSEAVRSDVFLNFFHEFGANEIVEECSEPSVEIVYDAPQCSLTESSIANDHFERTIAKVYELCIIEAKKPRCSIASNEFGHTKDRASNILAFLATPTEVQKAKKLFNEKLQYHDHPVKVRILDMHDRMGLAQQIINESLRPPYHHKVIFATEIAETAELVGVGYVVDCGLIVSNQWTDYKVSSDVELQLLSKYSASKRARLVKETEYGICYRLYSEKTFETMPDDPQPEIMTGSLLKNVLRIVASGISDITAFEFIDNIDETMLTQAITQLRALNALEQIHCRISLSCAGSLMLRLPIDVRLVYMIVLAKRYYLVSEAVILSACIHHGSFFRGLPKDLRSYCDFKKLAFAEESGDPVTYLNIMSNYIKVSPSEREKWCKENYLDFCTLQTIYSKANRIREEIHTSLAVNMSGVLNGAFNMEVVRKFIPYIYCKSFGHNFSVVCNDAEYVALNGGKHFRVHPSSAMKLSGSPPKYIVYGRLFNNFAISVCAADSKWLSQLENKDLKRSDEACLIELVRYQVKHGSLVRRKVREMKEEIMEKVNQCNCFREIGNPFDDLEIVIPKSEVKKLDEFIKEKAMDVLGDLKNTSKDIVVASTDYMLQIDGDCSASELLLKDEFCSVIITPGPDVQKTDEEIEDCLLKACSVFGKVIKVTKLEHSSASDAKNQWLVRMKDKYAAQSIRFVDCHLEPSKWDGKQKISTNASTSIKYRIKIRWWRRPSCGSGIVVIKHLNHATEELIFTAFRRYLTDRLPSITYFNPGEDGTFDVKLNFPIPRSWTEQDLLNNLDPIIQELKIQIADIYVRRKKAETESPLQLKDIISQIDDYCRETVLPICPSKSINRRNFEINLRPLKSKYDLHYEAYLEFDNIELGSKMLSTMESLWAAGQNLVIDNQEVETLSARYYYKVIINNAIYDVNSSDLNNLKHRVNLDVQLSFKRYNVTQTVISANMETVEDLLLVKNEVERKISGETLNCWGRDCLDSFGHRIGNTFVLFSTIGSSIFRNLQETYSNSLYFNEFTRKGITIWGSDHIIESFKEKLKDSLNFKYDKVIKVSIPMKPPAYPSDLMKKLAAEFNYNLDKMKYNFKHFGFLNLDIHESELHFQGTISHLCDLLAKLNSLSKPLSSAEKLPNNLEELFEVLNESPPACTICYCEIDTQPYRLEICGHIGCRSCFMNQINCAIKFLDVPLRCVNCEEPFVWKDIESLLSDKHDWEEIEENKKYADLVSASLKNFMNRKIGVYRHCSTADCQGIYEVTDDVQTVSCDLCKRELCSKCGWDVHNGMSCEEMEALCADADKSIKFWLSENSAIRARCPQKYCGAVIEKVAGCNHMLCPRCGNHFCWICKKIFSDPGNIYTHIEREHPEATQQLIMENMMNFENVLDFDPFELIFQ